MTTLIRNVSAVKIHTRDPLCVSKQSRHARGEFLMELLSGVKFIIREQVILVSLLGFPIDEQVVSASVDAFRKHPSYTALMSSVLKKHFLEHNATKASESRRDNHKTENMDTHVNALVTQFDEALQWLVSEGQRNSTAADELLPKVFGLSALHQVALVSQYRKHFFHELYRAVCNFIMRYLFVLSNGAEQESVSVTRIVVPKKMFVSILPLLDRNIVINGSSFRSVRTIRTPIPIADSMSWNLAHSGTSNLIPLLLNLFGFENQGEGSLRRHQRDECEIANGLATLQKELEDFHLCKQSALQASAQQCLTGYTLLCVSVAQSIEIQAFSRDRFRSSTLADAVEPVSNVLQCRYHRQRWKQHSATEFIAQASTGLLMSHTDCDVVLQQPEVGDCMSIILSRFNADRQTLLTVISPTQLREYRRTFCLMLPLDTEDQLQESSSVSQLVIAAVNINKLDSGGIKFCRGLPEDLVMLFLKSSVQVAMQPGTFYQLELADRLEILSAAVTIAEECYRCCNSVVARWLCCFDSIFAHIEQACLLTQQRRRSPHKLSWTRQRAPCIQSSSALITSILGNYDGGLSLERPKQCLRNSQTDIEAALLSRWKLSATRVQQFETHLKNRYEG